MKGSGPMQFLDHAKLSGVRQLDDGYIHADANVVRTGIQTYLGSEVGKPELDFVRVYRPETEVKDAKSVSTFSHAPITIGHPKERVTKDNWKSLAVGEVSTEAVWKDGKIRLPLILKDAKAIELVNRGTRELSAGYTCQLDWTPGEFEGQKYDAVQREIRVNHVAIVPRGRAGSECRIGDAAYWGAAPVNEENQMTMKTIVIGDSAVKVAAEDADAVEALRDRVKAQDAELAVKDGEIATLTQKVSDAEAKLNDTADLDARAEARAQLIDTARKLAPKVAVKGLSDQQIKEAVVSERRGAQAIKDKSPEYVAAAFDFLADEASKTPMRRETANPVRKVIADANAGGGDVPMTIADSQSHYERQLEMAFQAETK